MTRPPVADWLRPTGGVCLTPGAARTLCVGTPVCGLEPAHAGLPCRARHRRRAHPLDGRRGSSTIRVRLEMPARASREAGEIPARTRRCDRGRRPHEATVSSLTGRRGRRIDPEARRPVSRRADDALRGERSGGGACRGLENGGPGPDEVSARALSFSRPKGGVMQTGVMQAVLVREVGGYELTELPVPEPGPGEALIRVSVTGLCRTDLKIIRHGHRDLTLPRVPGEEVVGEVVGLGPPTPAAPPPGRAATHGRRRRPRVRVPRRVVRRVPELPARRREPLPRDAHHGLPPRRRLRRVRRGAAAEPHPRARRAQRRRGRVRRAAELLPQRPRARRRRRGRRARHLGRRPGRHAPQPGRRPARRRDGGDRARRAAPRPGLRPRGAARSWSTSRSSPSARPRRTSRPSPRSRRAAASSCSPACCPTPTTACTSASTACTTTSTPWSAPTAAASATARPRSTLLGSGGLRVDDLISHRLPLRDLEHGLDIVARRTGMKVHLYPDPALIPERSPL